MIIIASFQYGRPQYYWVQQVLRFYLATLSEVVGSNLTILKLAIVWAGLIYTFVFRYINQVSIKTKVFSATDYILAFSNTKKQNLLRVFQPRLFSKHKCSRSSY